MIHFLEGVGLGAGVMWAVMRYLVSLTVVKDKITGEVVAIKRKGRTFVDSAVHKMGL